MDKPRIFLGSSGKQEKLVHALTRDPDGVARVDPWTTSFNPGTTTLERHLARPRRRARAGRPFMEGGWQLSARYWSEAAKERRRLPAFCYY